MLTKREQQIIDVLKDHQQLSIKKLCQLIYASESTVRRALTTLEQKGIVSRYHGGATLIQSEQVESSHTIRGQKQLKEKQKIVKACSELLEHNASYFIDSSSTLSNLVPYLGYLNNVNIVTNGLNNSFYLSNNQRNHLFIAGGKLNTTTNSTLGTKTLQFLSTFTCDFFIFSCSGIDLNGIYEMNEEESQVKKAMLSHSKKHLLLVDSSKFNTSHFAKTCGFESIDYIITDAHPAQPYLDRFKEHGVEVIIAR